MCIVSLSIIGCFLSRLCAKTRRSPSLDILLDSGSFALSIVQSPITIWDATLQRVSIWFLE